MLHIGFANKYFTLWEVTGPHKVDYDTHIATIMKYTYIQNLSFDRHKAVQKVRDRVGNNYVVNLSLRGAKSFEKSMKVEYKPDKFLFGQYLNQPFEEVDDVGYLLWYYRNTVGTEKESPILKEYLVKIGAFLELSDGEVIEIDNIDKYLKDTFTKEVYNLNHFGQESERVTLEMRVRSIWSYEGMYGWVDVVEMVDRDNRLFYVRGSMKGVEDLKEGDIIVITGTISHKQWFDNKLGDVRRETQLKRPKLEEVFHETA